MKKWIENLAGPVVGLIIVFSVIGYLSSRPDQFRTNTTLVYGVFVNEERSVSVLVQDPDQTYKVQTLSSPDVRFVPDVPAGNVEFIQVTEKKSIGEWYPFRLIAHVHSLDKLQEGEWNHGKFGRG
jgi:hypothetical protein